MAADHLFMTCPRHPGPAINITSGPRAAYLHPPKGDKSEFLFLIRFEKVSLGGLSGWVGRKSWGGSQGWVASHGGGRGSLDRSPGVSGNRPWGTNKQTGKRTDKQTNNQTNNRGTASEAPFPTHLKCKIETLYLLITIVVTVMQTACSPASGKTGAAMAPI